MKNVPLTNDQIIMLISWAGYADHEVGLDTEEENLLKILKDNCEGNPYE